MTPYQQSFEINIRLQSLVVNFFGDYRQFAFLELSFVYDKSDQHKAIYDSYSVEVATQKITSLKIENASSTYALTNEIKYYVYDADDACWLHVQLVTFVCNESTIAHLTNYANNPNYQDLTEADKYFSSNEKLYPDLRRFKGYTNELESFTRGDSKLTLTVKLKDAATKTMRLRVTGYWNSNMK